MTDPNLPEGSDNKESPFNQPDIEVSDSDTEMAYNEICAVIEWDKYATQVAEELIYALELLGTEESNEAIDIIGACGKPNPSMALNQQQRDAIKAQAEAWVEDRAQEIAEDGSWLPW